MDCVWVKTVLKKTMKEEITKMKLKLCLQRSDLDMGLFQGIKTENWIIVSNPNISGTDCIENVVCLFLNLIMTGFYSPYFPCVDKISCAQTSFVSV